MNKKYTAVAVDSKALIDLSVDEVCVLFNSIDMEAHTGAVKKHKIKGLVLAELHSKDDLKEVDIIVPGPIGGAFLRQLDTFKLEGVPLSMLGSIKPAATTTSASVPGMNEHTLL